MSQHTKSTVKEIRILLKNGEYLEAMKKCKKLLKDDKKNYTAVVMLAAATKELPEFKFQTPTILKKAIEIQPNSPLAWQGLISYYEKEPSNDETLNELIPAYYKLLQSNNDPAKSPHYLDQLLKFSDLLQDTKTLETLIQCLIELRENMDISATTRINEALLNILDKFPIFEKQYKVLYGSLLATVIQNDDCPKQLDYYKKYLKHLFSEKKYVELFAAAAKMHEKYFRELCLLEWICRVYSEQKVLSNLEFDKNIQIDYFYETLLELDPMSYLGIFAKAMHLYQNQNYIDARDLLYQVVTLNSKLCEAWIALAEVNAKLHCWSEVESAAQCAFKLMNKNEALKERLDMLLIESMAKSEYKHRWNQAAEKCQEMLDKSASPQVKLLLARVRVLQDHPDAELLLNDLEKNEETQKEAMILRALALKNHECFEEAIDVLGSVLETSEAWQMLGEINWTMSNYSHSLMAFLKGVRADPLNWQCLVYLGHYYRKHGNDLDKSRKCYQKALRINPNSDEAGAGLSTAFRLLKNTEANMQMLQRVTSEEGGGPKWAWLQLGLQQLDQGDIAQAIKSLRFVIRADPNDNHCWESLADAYWARGAHTSALKSYQRALELSPGSLYPMIQLANIKLVLGRHDEAKEAFLQVLNQEHRYIPALKGLAETCLGLAKENAAKQLLGRSRRDAQQAVDSLTDAIVENSNLSCLWKLLGDAFYRVATLPEKYCYLEVVPRLIKSDSSKERVEIHKKELFTFSARYFCRALSITKDSAPLWHDLACCYLTQLDMDPSINRKVTADKCLEAAKQAVRLCATSWVHWNILGVICMKSEIKNYALAQHCWVMAIDREPNNAIAWTNLATLYLYLGYSYKANEAFSRAQRADPEYQNSWIGQALIAESVQHKEAMDLFRHATQLGYHPQAAVGYAHWVLTTLLNPEAKKDPLYSYVIVNMHAESVAADAMTWYSEREPNSIFGRNALGLFMERQNLLRSASHEFHQALKLFKDDEDKEAQVRTNLARVLVRLGEFNEAIEICQGIKSPSFNSQCQLALALFKASRFEESYAAYEGALNWLADAGSDKAHILCAMASMAYMCQDVDDVKTLLFQCIQIQPPIVAGLLAAAALGLLHDDVNLTTLVLKELDPYKDDSNYRHHVAVLSAYLCLMQQDMNGAIRVVTKAIIRRPDDVGLWIGLVRILMETNSNDFGNCAQKALHFGRKSWTAAVAQVACVSSLGQLVVGDMKNGFRSVQKTVHSFPGNVESWASLVVALLSRCEQKDSIRSVSWLSSLISILRSDLNITKPMDEWLLQNQKS